MRGTGFSLRTLRRAFLTGWLGWDADKRGKLGKERTLFRSSAVSSPAGGERYGGRSLRFARVIWRYWIKQMGAVVQARKYSVAYKTNVRMYMLYGALVGRIEFLIKHRLKILMFF